MDSNFQSAELLIDQIRDAYGRLTYTQLCHTKQATLLRKRHGHIKTLQTVLSALTTGSLLPVIFGNNKQSFAIISALLSVSLSIINIYVRNHDLGELSSRSKEIGDKLWLLREKYRSLLCDFQMRSISTTEACKRRDTLDQAIADVYSTAPTTSQKAYRLTQKALQTEEAMYFSDIELDQMLPIGLRKNTSDLSCTPSYLQGQFPSKRERNND